MPVRTSHIYMKHLKPGKKLWIIGSAKDETEYKRVPTLLEVLYVRKESFCSKVRVICPENQKGMIYGDYIYPGDLGIRPNNYDNRPTQLFNTKKACQRAIDFWKGKNPNFLVGK